MSRLSRIQEQSRRRIADLTTRCLSPEALGSKLLGELQNVVPFDGGRLFGIDPSTLLVNRVLTATDSDGWARLEWFREIYLAAEPLVYIELPVLMRAGLRAVAFHDRQEACWGYPPELLGRIEPSEHHRLFHELRSPVGGTLHVCFPSGGRWIAALQIYRRGVERPFLPGDVSVMRLVAPMIGDALQAALARERATRDVCGAIPEATGILILNPDSGIQLATPAGEAWCALLSGAERSGHGPLPAPVWSAVASLRAGAAGPAASTVSSASPMGPIRVEASWAGPDRSVSVVLSPERPPAPPDIPLHWSLTDQQNRLVSLLVKGMSNRRISAALSMSENTVEWHLRTVYEKLGVRSRTQLLARFFHETYGPSLATATEDHDR